MRDLFAEAHDKVYFHGGGATGKKVEIVGFRLGITAPEPCPAAAKAVGTAAPPPRRAAIFADRESRSCLVASRAYVDAEGALAGPALIEDTTSTIYIPPGWVARNDPFDNLIVTRQDS